jgi:hypothetical protein
MHNRLLNFLFLILLTACTSNSQSSLAEKQVASVQKQSQKKQKTDLRPSPQKVHKKKTPVSILKTAKKDSRPDNALLEETLKNMHISSLKIISKRSWSLKIYSPDNTRAVFKPFKKNNHTARFEVAYYRLAKLLDVKYVPVSVMGKFKASRINSLLKKRALTLSEDFSQNITPDSNGLIDGAVIEWMDNIAPLKTDKNTCVAVIKQALKNPAEPLAKNAARMIVLDFLLGNWDRFSGGNLFKIKDTDELALIDQNGSFSNLSKHQKEKITASLGWIKCIEPSFAKKIENLTEQAITSAVRLTDSDKTLLTGSQITRVLNRKAELQAILKSSQSPDICPDNVNL